MTKSLEKRQHRPGRFVSSLLFGTAVSFIEYSSVAVARVGLRDRRQRFCPVSFSKEADVRVDSSTFSGSPLESRYCEKQRSSVTIRVLETRIRGGEAVYFYNFAKLGASTQEGSLLTQQMVKT
ncbi:hypothetical protein STEG23_001831 [Scotinomys teguina]